MWNRFTNKISSPMKVQQMNGSFKFDITFVERNMATDEVASALTADEVPPNTIKVVSEAPISQRRSTWRSSSTGERRTKPRQGHGQQSDGER